MATQTIDHHTLSELVQAGAVRGAHVVGRDGGWALAAKYGRTERYLAATRSKQIRMFKRLETVVAYLRGIGISQFDVDAAHYDPSTTVRVNAYVQSGGPDGQVAGRDGAGGSPHPG